MKVLPLKKIAVTGILTAFALIAFVIENLFPPIFIPGARLGISNVFVLMALILCGIKYSFFTLVIKAVLGAVFSGNISSVLYSLPAGVIALTIQVLLFVLSVKFSIVAISALGSVINSTLQNFTFCIITGTTEFLVYLPYLALIGLVAGLFVGFAVYIVIKAFPKDLYERINDLHQIQK